ncbi:HesA/MoeB/ThiF family protein [Candidatus Nitrosacidococcus tergens]|uniref:Molybdopterin-synthase adenylyltransferase n=1 Tax=Candidatus Nitrosacidococcus tergens TaxID=553981 RepID=A0A7G1QBN1_9GAMM|nr:molybdopterin-synthase adenylyltransferase MoeB [Candidatus Nitrosacidococcus tergens]CAB1277328.1 Molybdopterin-synthase adenylyltransferase [Candidatus Nitrosacidococcus tergens]
MNDQQLLRYSRHILLPQIDIEGQERLLKSKVLLVGVGGLGSPIALYLAGSGIGKIILVDPDQVELSNLQRQIIHNTQTIGTNKVDSAKNRMLALNPEIQIEAIPAYFTDKEHKRIVDQVDIVIDGSDNFATRFDLNASCAHLGKPFISGSAIRTQGQVAIFDNRQQDSACYHCLYNEIAQEEEETCTQSGVFSPLLGIIGSIQAAEALRLLLNLGRKQYNRLLLVDAVNMGWQEMTIAKDPKCPICS